MSAPYRDVVVEVIPTGFGYQVRALTGNGAAVVSETRVYADLATATEAAKRMAHWLRGAVLRVGAVV